MRWLLKWIASAIIAIQLLSGSGCSSEGPWRTHDIAGIVPELSFALTDDSGRAVTAKDFRGKVTLLFFGFTHCPDVCPTALGRLEEVLRSIDAGRDDVRVLFVTVDPQRDSTRAMHEYVQAFGPQFVGLRGDAAALDAFTRRYRVTYSLGKADAQGNYEVTHSSAVFVFGRDGLARLMFTPKDTTAAIAEDLRRLVLASGHGAG